MAKKTITDPLDNLDTYDPGATDADKPSESAIATQPVSPLRAMPTAGEDSSAIISAAPVELILEEANWQIQQLRKELVAEQSSRRDLEKRNYELEAAVKVANRFESDLENERKARLDLERRLAAMEVEVRDVEQLQSHLEEERSVRLELERKTATLEVLSEKARELASQIAEERQARLELERDKATLDVEIEHAKKLEVFLAEERSARMNAQSRAASAEARLSRLEGEVAQQESAGSASFFRRLFGR